MIIAECEQNVIGKVSYLHLEYFCCSHVSLNLISLCLVLFPPVQIYCFPFYFDRTLRCSCALKILIYASLLRLFLIAYFILSLYLFHFCFHLLSSVLCLTGPLSSSSPTKNVIVVIYCYLSRLCV